MHAGFYLNLPVVVISADTTGHGEYPRSSLVDPSYELRSHSQSPLVSCGASPNGGLQMIFATIILTSLLIIVFAPGPLRELTFHATRHDLIRS